MIRAMTLIPPRLGILGLDGALGRGRMSPGRLGPQLIKAFNKGLQGFFELFRRVVLG